MDMGSWHILDVISCGLSWLPSQLLAPLEFKNQSGRSIYWVVDTHWGSRGFTCIDHKPWYHQSRYMDRVSKTSCWMFSVLTCSWALIFKSYIFFVLILYIYQIPVLTVKLVDCIEWNYDIYKNNINEQVQAGRCARINLARLNRLVPLILNCKGSWNLRT
jgi:hypothetical protein